MLGQHPQMYAFPETHLFGDDTMRQWWERAASADYPMDHGLLRATAQIIFGAQTDHTVSRASGWLRRRSHCTTAFVFDLLSRRSQSRVVIEKSPSTVHHLEHMERVRRMFPHARFLHLVRHPRGYAESVLKAIRVAEQHGDAPPWLLNLAAYRPVSAGRRRGASDVDPQKSWYVLNATICRFLRTVPEGQQLRARGEDVLAKPDELLPQICSWIGVRVDAASLDAMQHPERSPYACFGPPTARFGNDHFFMRDPVLRPARAVTQSLAGSLRWRGDARGFATSVKQLAADFGYA
jgi:hypothetical protein